MGDNKKFNKSLFGQYDSQSKEAVITYFKTVKGVEFQENDNLFDVDLVNKERGIGLELECRGKWNGENYPYPVVNVLFRKKALFDGSHTLKNYLIILNNTFDRAIAIKPADIKPYITDDNCHETVCFVEGEGFRKDFVYRIPLEAFKKFSLN